MMIGTLAITGVGIPLTHIGFAGFLSKDAIIESAWAGGTAAARYAFLLLLLSALLTSFYSWRLIFLTFYGEPRGDHHAHDHAHESPRTMLIPLGVLAVGAVLAGMVWYKPFFGDHESVEVLRHAGPRARARRRGAEATAATPRRPRRRTGADGTALRRPRRAMTAAEADGRGRRATPRSPHVLGRPARSSWRRTTTSWTRRTTRRPG